MLAPEFKLSLVRVTQKEVAQSNQDKKEELTNIFFKSETEWQMIQLLFAILTCKLACWKGALSQNPKNV